jgi:hypothetical protein
MVIFTSSHFYFMKNIFILLAVLSCFCTSGQEAVQTLQVITAEPLNRNPQLYEKVEWGIALPPQVDKAVKNWVSNNYSRTKFNPARNPFDPADIDVSGTIEYQKDGKMMIQRVFGFYYRDYMRITETNNPDSLADMDDPDNWKWQEENTDLLFRIRWAPDAIGSFLLRVNLQVRGMGNFQSEPIPFQCTGGSLADSFISVTNNKHYLKTDDGRVFMPVGLNITEGSFGCNCQEGAHEDDACETCYEWGTNDPCCGVKLEKRRRSGIPGTRLMEYSLAPAAYVKLEQILGEIKKAGGNAFRTFLDPMAFEVEFERMNDYYDRQYQAWEMDQMLDRCHELDLRVELNLQYHYSIAYHSYGMDRFDWDDTYNCLDCGKDYATTGTKGWCYNAECPDVEDPVDFLTSECARKNYKKKLRYIISRWGYSSNIFVMELMSEMNNIGHGSVWEVNIDTDGDGQTDDMREIVFPSLYYADTKRTRPAVASWHKEMARYIKEDLGHKRHLIAADYTGTAPMTPDLNMDGDCTDIEIGENCNPCQSPYFDDSWMSSEIDIMAFSNYTGSLNRWEKMSVHEYSKNNQSEGLMCGWNDPSTMEDDGKWNSPLGSYESMWKPVIHAENGLTPCMADDYTGFVKDMLADVFGGHATSGMSWDEWSRTDHWHYMGQVNNFLQRQVLDSVDIGTGSWTPNHSYSERSGELKRTKFAESIYLLSPEKNRFFGCVMNRSWNYYSIGKGSCITEERRNEFRGVDAPLSKLTKVESDSDKLMLKGSRGGRYVVRYYDPTNGALVREIKKKGKRGKLELDEYPAMFDGSEGAQPFYYFTVHPEGKGFSDRQ